MAIPTLPALHKHHEGKSWTTYWRDSGGKLRVKRFGKESRVSAREARTKYQRWMETEWSAKPSVRNPDGAEARYTCVTLAAQYLRHASKTFRKHGRPTSHVTQIRYAMRALRDARGEYVAESMESPHLAELRDWMIHGEKIVRRRDPQTGNLVDHVERYKRSITTVNGRLLIIKEAFEWAREKGRVPRMVVLDLQTVKPLARGRSEAKNPRKVPPIAMAVVEATLPSCSRVVAGMIQVNMYSGARPGEVCIMRPCDLEMCTPDCWIYRPGSHKGEHKELTREIALGPKAIEAIRPFLERQLSVQGFIFSPAEARTEHDAARRAAFDLVRQKRGTPRPPSQVARGQEQAADPKRKAGRLYTEESYRKAIHHACRKAGIDPWNPNQLRHTHGTEVRRVFGLAGLQDVGLDAARDALGHQDSRTSEIYARESLERAMVIARRIG